LQLFIRMEKEEGRAHEAEEVSGKDKEKKKQRSNGNELNKIYMYIIVYVHM